jgi:hypothetical protein
MKYTANYLAEGLQLWPFQSFQLFARRKGRHGVVDFKVRVEVGQLRIHVIPSIRYACKLKLRSRAKAAPIF